MNKYTNHTQMSSLIKYWHAKCIAVLLNLYPNVAKAGRLQSQGANGEAVVVYCEPFETLDLESSGFPEG